MEYMPTGKGETMTDKAIYLEWDETEDHLTGWRYAGNGETLPEFEHVTVTRSARYSSDTSAEMLARAKAYVKSDRPDARIRIRDDA